MDERMLNMHLTLKFFNSFFLFPFSFKGHISHWLKLELIDFHRRRPLVGRDELLSGKVINISRVIKLSLSSHDNAPVNDPFCSPPNHPRSLIPASCLAGVEVGSDCEQAASLWRATEPFSNCLGLLTRPKPEFRAWRVAKQRGDLMRL